jgi:ERCC4-type nuclease
MRREEILVKSSGADVGVRKPRAVMERKSRKDFIASVLE